MSSAPTAASQAAATAAGDPAAAVEATATLPRHPIGVVCRRTGLKADLVRAWEKRYGAVVPRRGRTARRLYSDRDIERFRLLLRATQGGRGISQIAGLTDEQLTGLIADDERAQRGRGASIRREGDSQLPGGLGQACLRAVAALDGQQLRLELEQAAAHMSRRDLIEQVLVPLVHAIGTEWREGHLRPVHEHLATAVVTSFLANLQGAYRAPYWAPNLVVTTPAGQQHEIGALLVSATAAAEGWYVAYLGPNLPAEDIAIAAQEVGAKAVALSIVHPVDDPALAGELRRLRQLLSADVPLIVGGRATGALGTLLDEIGALRPGTLDALCQTLSTLAAQPRGASPTERRRRQG